LGGPNLKMTYFNQMIRSFRHKGLQQFFLNGNTKGIQEIHAKRLRLLLTALNQAEKIGNLGSPGFDLHPLKGEFDGLWAIKVNRTWRLVFRFEAGDIFDVDYLDYH
jgi:proteic killer suppression protein